MSGGETASGSKQDSFYAPEVITYLIWILFCLCDLLATCEQQFVQLFQVPHLRHRRQPVTAELPAFSFHLALFIAAGRIAELRFIAPVRAERYEARRLFALIHPHSRRHSTGFFDDHLTVTSELAHSELRWQAFLSTKEITGYISLLLEPRFALIIPLKY